MSFDLKRILRKEGFITEQKNLIQAERAFFAARVIHWVRECAMQNKDFNIATYLTMISYYKHGLADLKFSEDGDKLYYKMKTGEEVDKIAETMDKSSPESYHNPEEDSSPS